MSFLAPNQQCQSTEDNNCIIGTVHLTRPKFEVRKPSRSEDCYYIF